MLDISSKQLNYIIEHIYTESQLAHIVSDLFSVAVTSELTTYYFKCKHINQTDFEFVLYVKVHTDLPEALCEAYADGQVIFNCHINELYSSISDAYRYGTV